MARGLPVGCGQCLPCRINHKRLWTWRQYLESLCHEENCFVTLTYSKDALPEGETLVPEHHTLFIKALRERVSPLRFRFFGVGEYGDLSARPHYHYSIFGLGEWARDHVQEAWSKGHTLTAEFNSDTAQYVAGYTTKKMTRKDDPRLNGRYPEFTRKSNRPGLGAPAMPILAKAIGSHLNDAPSFVQVGSRKVPLGRYLIRKLREEMGVSTEVIETNKQKVTDETIQNMQDLYLLSQNTAKPYLSQKEALVKKNLGRSRSAIARHKLKTKGSL